MRAEWVPVTVPVEAKVGAVHLRLFPYTREDFGTDDSYERPWAWGAMCRVTFRFGRLVTSKKITQRYAYPTKLGWATPERPSDSALAEGRQTVLDNLRAQIEMHGVKCDGFQIEEPAEA